MSQEGKSLVHFFEVARDKLLLLGRHEDIITNIPLHIRNTVGKLVYLSGIVTRPVE